MRALKYMIGAVSLAILMLFSFGCKDILISGTFVIVETIYFEAQGSLYFYQVDITDDSDWQDHKDDIDKIDAVGVEFYITSSEAVDVTFNAYIDDHSGPIPFPSSVPSSATKVINDFTVAPGTTKITYAESLKILTGLDRLKALAKIGKFDYYGTVSGGTGGNFVIDSAKVIVTVSAS